jgi:hypothetical protein
MMTSNGLGLMAAEIPGQGKLEQTIAQRAPGGRVAVLLKPAPQAAAVLGEMAAAASDPSSLVRSDAADGKRSDGPHAWLGTSV